MFPTNSLPILNLIHVMKLMLWFLYINFGGLLYQFSSFVQLVGSG
jgi:hypothetical protein